MKTSSKEWKRRARENLTGHYKTPMGAFVLAGLITFVIELPFSMLQNSYATAFQSAIYLIVEVLISLIGTVLSAGVLSVHLKMARRQEYRISQIFGPFKNRPDRYLIVGFLLMLFSAVPMIPGVAVTACAFFYPMTWLIILAIFLVLSGIAAAIYLMLRLSLVYYVMLDDEELTARQAIMASAELTEHRTGRLLLLYLSFLGYMILGVITLGIGMLWISPYQTQTVTQFYLDARGESAPHSYI